jgi:transketolase
VFTHDSIGVGQDGETHQPIEQLTALRSTPELKVYRPADRRETACAWVDAVTGDHATALVLSRQNLSNEYPTTKDTLKGAYLVKENANSQAVILASGSELGLAMEAEEILAKQGVNVNVLSVPCMERFYEQGPEYMQSVLPESLRSRVSIEAGATMPWYRLVGLDGKVIGIDHYGASSDPKVLFQEYGMTAERVVAAVLELVK